MVHFILWDFWTRYREKQVFFNTPIKKINPANKRRPCHEFIQANWVVLSLEIPILGKDRGGGHLGTLKLQFFMLKRRPYFLANLSNLNPIC